MSTGQKWTFVHPLFCTPVDMSANSSLEFSLVCQLLENLSSSTSQHLSETAIQAWFQQHDAAIDRKGPGGLALLSCLLPEKRADRIYGLSRARLEGIVAQSLKLARILSLNAVMNTEGQGLSRSRPSPPRPLLSYNVESRAERSSPNVGFKHVQITHNITRRRQNPVRRQHTIDRSLDKVSMRFRAEWMNNWFASLRGRGVEVVLFCRRPYRSLGWVLCSAGPSSLRCNVSRSAPCAFAFPFSIVSRITLGCVLLLSSSFILDVLIVQYSVSVMVEGIRLLEEKDGRLLGWLFGGVRAIAAHEADALVGA
jgi:hypothetical protein